jgi:hypothetical protein
MAPSSAKLSGQLPLKCAVSTTMREMCPRAPSLTTAQS